MWRAEVNKKIENVVQSPKKVLKIVWIQHKSINTNLENWILKSNNCKKSINVDILDCEFTYLQHEKCWRASPFNIFIVPSKQFYSSIYQRLFFFYSFYTLKFNFLHSCWWICAAFKQFLEHFFDFLQHFQFFCSPQHVTKIILLNKKN